MVKYRPARTATLPVLIVLALVASAAPALAEETLYIPLGMDPSLNDGTHFATRLLLSNLDDAELRRVSYVAIPQGEDGSALTDATSRWTFAGSARSIELDTSAGLLVLSGNPEMIVNARWVRRLDGTPGGQNDGASVPVLRHHEAIAVDETAWVQGLERYDGGATAVTSFAVLNLGDAAASCTVAAYGPDGTSYVQDVVFNIQPLSSIHVRDAIGALGRDDLSDVRVSTTCDQPFFPYATITYKEDGRVVVLRPAGSLAMIADSGDDGGGDDGGGDDGGGDDGGGGDPAGNFIYLSDLNWIFTANVLTGPHKDRGGWEGHPPGGGFVGGFKLQQIGGTTYQRGVAWFGNWSRNSSVTWNLGGQYRLLTFDAGFDDYMDPLYEWALVNLANNQFIRLQRPPDGWGGRERPNQFRVGSSGTVRVYGDGRLLFETDELHNYSRPFPSSVNVAGVQQLRIELNINAFEELNAPYRNGLLRRTFLIGNSWFDAVNIADAKLFTAN